MGKREEGYNFSGVADKTEETAKAAYSYQSTSQKFLKSDYPKKSIWPSFTLFSNNSAKDVFNIFILLKLISET